MSSPQEDKLVNYVRQTVTRFYEASLDSEQEDKETLKYIEGLLASLMLLGLYDKAELQEMLDSWHFAVFKVTRAQRRVEKALQKGGDNWLYFDTPTVSRKAKT